MVPELDDIFLSNLNENFIESIERDIFINAFATSLDACYVLCKHIRECKSFYNENGCKEDSVTVENSKSLPDYILVDWYCSSGQDDLRYLYTLHLTFKYV